MDLTLLIEYWLKYRQMNFSWRQLNAYNDYICAEILADINLNFCLKLNDGNDIEVNDIQLKVNVNKKGK